MKKANFSHSLLYTACVCLRMHTFTYNICAFFSIRTWIRGEMSVKQLIRNLQVFLYHIYTWYVKVCENMRNRFQQTKGVKRKKKIVTNLDQHHNGYKVLWPNFLFWTNLNNKNCMKILREWHTNRSFQTLSFGNIQCNFHCQKQKSNQI